MIEELETSLAIISLNYNTSEKVINQVSQLIDEGLPSSMFYIVDNDSLQEDKQQLQNFAITKQINFIQALENGGYAKGNKIGVENALSDKKKYFLILNPDIEISSSVIKVLFNKIASEKYLYFVGPRICDRYQQEIIFSDGGTLNKDFFFEANHVNVGKNVDAVDITEVNYDIDYVDGSAIMFKKETLDLIGMMRDDFFMYFEEAEWCYRLKKIPNSKQAIITSQIVYHELSQSNTFKRFYMTRNRIFMCRLYKIKHGKLISKLFYNAQKKLFNKKGSFLENTTLFFSQLKAIAEGELKKL